MGNYTDSKQIFTTALSKGSPTLAPELVLSHDILNATVHDFAPFMLAKLKQLGYRAVPVGECLNDPPEFWYRDPVTGGALVASLPAKAPTSSTGPAPVSGKPTAKPTSLPSTGDAIMKGFTGASSGYLDIRDSWVSAFAFALIALIVGV